MNAAIKRLIVLAIAVLLSPGGEAGYASAQPTASVANSWHPPQRRRSVLMRHGDVSYFDAQGKPVTDPDTVVLNEKGRAEADATGAYLKTIGLGKFDRVISSTLPRTVETADRVMKVLGQAGGPTEVEALREIRIGPPQNVRDIPTPELPKAILGMMQARVSGDQSLFEARLSQHCRPEFSRP